MKKTLLIVVAMCGIALTAGAQTLKFGSVDLQSIMMLMPETDSMKVKFEQRQADYSKQLQDMQKELQTKAAEYAKNVEQYSQVLRQQKEKELSEGDRSLQEFQQMATQDLQQYEQELVQPIYKRIIDTVEKVSTAQGIDFVLGIGSEPFVYYNKAKTTNLTEQVKKALGI